MFGYVTAHEPELKVKEFQNINGIIVDSVSN